MALIDREDAKTQLVVVLSFSEKRFIVDAAKEYGAASLSAFIRDIVLEKSRNVLGREPAPRIKPVAGPANAFVLLNACIGARSPAEGSSATAFPSIHAFAAHLSDRNRAILRWIAGHEAESIHDLSRRFDYSYAGLSRTLCSLAAFGVIGYDPCADARCQSPYLLCRRIRLHLPFRDDAGRPARIFKVTLGSAAGSAEADYACRSMSEFSTAITDRGYDLLRLIAAQDPPSIGALGKLTGKTSQNAYPLLKRLARFGLVRAEGDVRSKRPVLLYDGLALDIDLVA